MVPSEYQMLHETASNFAAHELAPEWGEHDEHPFKPLFTHVLRKAHETGFFAVMMPEEHGGFNRSVRALGILLNAVCRVDASLGGILFTQALAQEILMNAGAGELLASRVSGAGGFESALIAFPSFDNPREISLRAAARKRRGPGYELNGAAEYVAAGGLAGQALVPAVVEGQEAYSFFLVGRDQAGVRCSAPVVSLGLHACPAVDMSFRGAEAVLVGQEQGGGACFDRASDRLGAATAAMAAGVIRGSLQVALDYARQRTQGGRPIANWSQVRMMLSSMAVRLRCADLAIASACSMVDEQAPGWQLASRAVDLLVSEMACEATSDGIQVLGGNGYMHDYSQEKSFRDARQIQALMGLAPMRKLAYIQRILDGDPL